MRVFTIFILALAVLYGGLCAAGAKSGIFVAQAAASALDAAVAATPPCHSSPSDAVPVAPMSDASDTHCCEISSTFAVSSGLPFEVERLPLVSHFFVIDAAPQSPSGLGFAMVETTAERTAFPELRILYASFLI